MHRLKRECEELTPSEAVLGQRWPGRWLGKCRGRMPSVAAFNSPGVGFLPFFFFCLTPYPASMFLGITFQINSLNLCLRGNPKRSHRVTGAVSSLDRPIHASAQGLYWEGPNSWRTGVFKSSLNAHRAPQRTGIRRIFRGLTRKLRKFQLPTSS